MSTNSRRVISCSLEIGVVTLLFHLTVNSSISKNWFILSLLIDSDLTAKVMSLYGGLSWGDKSDHCIGKGMRACCYCPLHDIITGLT
jgi:hypothetical protein